MLKKLFVALTISFIIFAGFAWEFNLPRSSIVQGQAVTNERSYKLVGLTSWSGTLPISSTYIDISGTSVNCDFALSGKANKQDSNSVFGINTTSNSSLLVISKPSYINAFTAFQMEAYHGSGTAKRGFTLNGSNYGITIDGPVTFANPKDTSKIILNSESESISLETTSGQLVIKSITLYYY